MIAPCRGRPSRTFARNGTNTSHPRKRPLALLAFLLALLPLPAAVQAAEAAQPAVRPAKAEFTFVQITDTHIGRAPENALRLFRLVANINTLAPQPVVVIHTGDIVEKRRYENGPAQQARTLLAALKAPLLPLPGNNDLDAATADRDHASWLQYFGPLARAKTIQGVRFILFCAEPLRGEYVLKGYNPLEWLRTELTTAKQRNEPVLLFLHAPPVSDFYENSPHPVYPPAAERALLQLLDELPPAAVLAGHFHRDEQHEMRAYRIYVCPPIDSRWDRQAAFRLYAVHRTGDQLTLSYTTQYDFDSTASPAPNPPSKPSEPSP